MVDYVDAELFEDDSLDKQIHVVSEDNTINITNDDIVSNSFELTESLCSEQNIKFGAFEPRSVKFTIKNTLPKLVGKWFNITMTLDGSETPFNFGKFCVRSDRPSSDRITRDIVAYSYFYSIMKNRYKNWYKSAFGNSKTMTVKQFRDSFFSYLHERHSWVAQETTSLINDNAIITKSKKISRISGKDILNAICEINGVFGYIGRDNVFHYLSLHNSQTAYEITKNLTISADYEDYTTVTIDRVEILAQDGSIIAAAGASAAASENKYTVESNFMLKGMGKGAYGKENALIMAENLLTQVTNMSYVPFDAEFKGNPCFEIGDKISFESHGSTITTFILQRQMKGIQSLHDNYGASGDETQPETSNPIATKVNDLSNVVATKADIDNGYDTPEEEFLQEANNGDLYVQFESDRVNLHPIDLDNVKFMNYDIWTESYQKHITDENDLLKVLAAEWASDGYAIDLGGRTFARMTGDDTTLYGSGYNGTPVFKVPDARFDGTYTLHCKVKYSSTYRNDTVMGTQLGFSIVHDRTDFGTNNTMDTFAAFSWGGGALNIAESQNVWHEYEFEFRAPNTGVTDGFFYIAIVGIGAQPHYSHPDGTLEMQFRELYMTFVEDGSSDQEEEFEDNVKSLYTYKEKTVQNTSNTRSRSRSVSDNEESVTGEWREIKFLSGANTKEYSGLSVSSKKVLSLTPDVMRAWFKADPPQADRNFNQFCVRYTGAPDASAEITAYSGVGWSNTEIKQASDGSYKIQCGGDKASGTVTYFAYKIENLTSGVKYYFNFAANFSNNATFGGDTTKSLGVVFNTTGTISSDAYSGDPHTFDDETLYESFYRSNKKHYYDFGFTATAATMYMCIVLGDLDVSTGVTLTLSEFVLSKTARKYIRKFYLYDIVEKEWLEYRPFGTGDDGGSIEVSALSDLTDVAIDNLQNNQIIQYNSTSGKWENTTVQFTVDYDSLSNRPQVNSVTLTGNKTTRDLGMIQELTQAEYDVLPSTDKNNPDKVYYIKDGGGSGGGGGGASALDELSDVDIGTLTDGDVLTYDANEQKWVNATSGGGGGNYSETTLYSTGTSTNGEFTLSDDINNYKELIIQVGWSDANIGGEISIRVNVADFVARYTYVASPGTSTTHLFCFLYGSQYCRIARASSDTKLYLFDNHSAKVKKVIGIKY